MTYSLFRLLIAPALFLVMGFTQVSAQCEYRLDMFDGFGDGWSGGRLAFAQGTRRDTFSLGLNPGDGRDSTVYIPVVNGQPFTLTWIGGTFPIDVTFELFDNRGVSVLRRSNPQAGVVYAGQATCPICSSPNVRVLRVLDNAVRLQLTPATETVQDWLVIYGPRGFTPGRGRGDTAVAYTTLLTLTKNIKKLSEYDIYVQQRCDTVLSSTLKGPFTVRTYRTRDVGICGVKAPVSACNLQTEEVTILMQNYGAVPQTLIPFDYSVNGVPAGITRPDDGLYTGVIGQDSCLPIKFERKYNFSGAGEYIIKTWTALEGDENPRNDTFTHYLISRIVLPYRQTFEVWPGGWQVDKSSQNASWQHGTPSGRVLKSAFSGKNVWATNLSGPYSANERSYLNLPCFDFTTLGSTAPVLEARIQYDFAANDGAWFEISNNGGVNWTLLGARGQGLNWYTGALANVGRDAWTGRSNGWTLVRFTLPSSLAGNSDVRIRLATYSDAANQAEGIAIDDVRVYVPLATDLASLTVTADGATADCGLAADRLSVEVANVGRNTVNTFTVAYSVNGGTPVVETVNTPLSPNQRTTYKFTQPFNSADGTYTVRVWTNLTEEQNRTNDTLVYRIDRAVRTLPFRTNFESGTLPDGWVTDQGAIVSDHGNTSRVLAVWMDANTTTFRHQLPRYGPITANDTLRFDYRIVEYETRGATATTLAGNATVQVSVSTDCGANYTPIFTASATTHAPSTGLRTVVLPLRAYAGQRILIRIQGTRTAGSYWVDIDNVNIGACPARFGLTLTNVQPASPTQNNGAATINANGGAAPYTFRWSNGATTATVTNLPIGPATVTVTDSRGCTDELRFNVGNTAVADIAGLQALGLRPNPTAGLAELYISMEEINPLEVLILNTLGQQIKRFSIAPTRETTLALDLSSAQDGVYFVQIVVRGQQRTLRLVKQRAE